MNQKQATAKLKKIVGKKLAWRINSNALAQAERDEQSAVCRSMRETEKALKAALDEMRAKLLNDPVYVQLRADWNAAKDAADRALSKSHRKPIEVGRMGELFFTVLASGDSWADVIEQLSSSDQSTTENHNG
jgi:hypothetical protein